MSHQDRKSPQQQVVVNHQVLREVIAWLLPSTLFAGMRVRQGSTWKPRTLAAAALFWATSDRPTLGERLDHARKIIKRIFRGQAEPGHTYRGFMKMLDKWHARLLLSVVSELRLRMGQELADQFQVGGFTVFAGDGSRVATPRTESNQQAFSPRRKQKRNRKNKSKRSKSQRARQRKTEAAQTETAQCRKTPSAEKRRNNLPPRSRRRPT